MRQPIGLAISQSLKGHQAKGNEWAEVLNVPYAHLVFTLPPWLNGRYGAHRYFPEGGGSHDGTLGFAASACMVRIDTPWCTARERHCSGAQIGRGACN